MRKSSRKVNHWIFSRMTTNRLLKLNNQSKEAMASTGLKGWQWGLIGGFSMFEIEIFTRD